MEPKILKITFFFETFFALKPAKNHWGEGLTPDLSVSDLVPSGSNLCDHFRQKILNFLFYFFISIFS